MMELLNKYNLTPKKVLKTAGLVLASLVILGIAMKLIGSSVSPIIRQTSLGFDSAAGNMKSMDMAMDDGVSYEAAESFGLSARNIAPSSDYNQGATGSDSEDYEVTEYYTRIETRNLQNDCTLIASLKPREDVIFEIANEADTYCNYYFKVAKESAPEILSLIESLDPKDLNENTRTIKNRIDDYTSEEEILLKKLAVIDNTLNDAIESYDEIARIATQARDAESLAKIIDSKIRIIESLSQQKVNITTQLDRLSRSKAEQLDKLEYVYFRVNIFENKFIDGEQIKDSWKSEVQGFVRDLNEVVQKSSIGLLLAVFVIVQYALYILLIVIVARLGWKILRKIWKREESGNLSDQQ